MKAQSSACSLDSVEYLTKNWCRNSPKAALKRGPVTKLSLQLSRLCRETPPEGLERAQWCSGVGIGPWRKLLKDNGAWGGGSEMVVEGKPPPPIHPWSTSPLCRLAPGPLFARGVPWEWGGLQLCHCEFHIVDLWNVTKYSTFLPFFFIKQNINLREYGKF